MKNNLIPKAAVLTTLALAALTACKDSGPADKQIHQLPPAEAAAAAKAIEAVVTPQLAEGLTLSVWGVDSLVADPVSIDIDDDGKLYYTRTIRQKNSEFDIRGHQDWELQSIALKDINDKRAFLRKVLAPENSANNTWLEDLNHDGSHDWKDMTVEREQVFRLEDTDGDGVADFSQRMVNDFNDEVTDAAGAVLKHGDDLFVGIGPDMWRLKDTNGDGLADSKTSISHGYGIHVGFSGHGMSGLEVGPEGKLYWQIGDIGFNGVSLDGKKHDYANSGVIVRANPDGSDFEVFAYGNRNMHEFVFDDYGNLISVDNDGDHPGENERLVYVVEGSDTGWRINWQFGKYRDPENNTYKVWMDERMYKPRFEGQAAYILPCIANYVNGPTGMLYNPGTALGPAWKNTFFVGEFVGNPARSGIHAFKLKPKGATFELGETQKVLGNVLATGIDFGPDGAMYLADWVDGWGTKDYGRIWKLDGKDGVTPERKQVQTLLAADFTDYDVNTLGEHLKSPDLRVRQKAQFELASRGDKGLEAFQKSIAQTDNQLARVNAIWGISQLARKNMKHAAVLIPLLKDNDPEIRAQAAKWLGDVRYKEAGDALIPLLNDSYSRARFFAAEALGRIAHEPAVTPIITLLRANNDEDAYIRHAGSLALARIGKVDPVKALATDPSRAVRIAAVVALRRMKAPEITAFLTDTDEFVVTETARAINDDLSIEAALPALGDLLATTHFAHEALIRRAVNANLRAGTDKALQNLVAYAARTDAPAAMRAEALAALSTWPKPSVVDRVDGRYRGEITRDPTAVQTAATQPLINLASDKDVTVRLAAVKASGKLKINKAASTLLARLKSDPQPVIRAEALKALSAINAPEIGNAIAVALSDKEKSVRVTGLDLLGKMAISKDLMVKLLADVIRTKTPEEKQAALITLSTLPVANTKPVLEELLTVYASGKLPPEVHLELAEAIDSTHAQDLIARYKAISSKTSTDSLKAAYAGSLYGGDADRGRRIFFSNQAAQCLRCHSYDDMGGTAGPRLNGAAKRLSRQQLLEALVEPSARLAPGFGNVTLNVKNGKTVSGILINETDKSITVKVGDKPDTVINAADIVKRTNATSSMPPMPYLLTKKEIRDVVSFLATLEEDN